MTIQNFFYFFHEKGIGLCSEDYFSGWDPRARTEDGLSIDSFTGNAEEQGRFESKFFLE